MNSVRILKELLIVKVTIKILLSEAGVTKIERGTAMIIVTTNTKADAFRSCRPNSFIVSV